MCQSCKDREVRLTDLDRSIMNLQVMVEHLRNVYREQAETAHSAYPQYKGHWDGWRLAKVLKTVYTKAGMAFVCGCYTIAKIDKGSDNGPIVVAYSQRNRCDTQLNYDDVIFLE